MTSLPTPTDRTKPRAAATVGAVLAALAVWALALALGADVDAPVMGDGAAEPIGAGQVTLTAAVAALAGWGLLALLERFTARAAGVWAAVAIAFTLVSLGAPLTAPGIGAANRAVLTALHLVVAAVVVPVLYRTSRGRRQG